MTATAEQTITITVRVPESLRAQLDALAEATERPRQYHALAALHRYVEAETWIIDRIQAGLRAADAGEFASPERVAAVFDKYSSQREQRAE
jgi:RHH-type rel operon transcriptional repressor/antitoxin RelB